MFLRILAAILILQLMPGAALAQEPILVGGIFAETGRDAFIGLNALRAVKVKIRQINEAGGVLGRPLRLIQYDTESIPEVALRIARELAETDKVLAILGPSSTSEGMAVKQYIEAEKIPAIMAVGADAVIAGGRFGEFAWTFKTPQRTHSVAARVLAYLKGKGITRVGLLTSRNIFGQDGFNAFSVLAPKYGVTLVSTETIDPNGTDFSKEVSRLQACDAQAAVLWTVGPSHAWVAKALAALPGEKPFLVASHAIVASTFLTLAGEAAEGAVMPATKLLVAASLPGTDPQKTPITAFVDAYKAQGLTDASLWNVHSGYAADAVSLLALAIQKAGAADRGAVRDALENLRNVPGVSGVYSMSPKDHNGLPPESVIMLQVRGGKLVEAR